MKPPILTARSGSDKRRPLTLLLILLLTLAASPSPLAATSSPWTSAGTMQRARAGHTATSLPSGVTLVAGGHDVRSYMDSAERYNFRTNSWSSAGAMAEARYGHTATLLSDGTVLVVGGVNGASSYYLDSSEIYDPATDSWSPAGSLAQARYDHTATLLPDGRVMIAGGSGRTGSFSPQLSSVELYDPMSRSWSSARSMVQARSDHTATLLQDGRVLVVGGFGGEDLGGTELGGYLDSAELYDPSTDSWSSAGSMLKPRLSHTTTVLLDGRVLVAGGSSGTHLNSSELYNPAHNSWASAAPMVQARYSHTATLLRTGTVLVVGGTYRSHALDRAELYDPETDSWSSAATTTGKRSDHTTTLLPNGKVLVAGGARCCGNFQSSAELFDPKKSWIDLERRATADRFIFAGSVSPAHPEKQVSVTLFKRDDGRFVRVLSRSLVLNSDSRYRTNMPRPGASTCRVRASFSDTDHIASSVADTFRC